MGGSSTTTSRRGKLWALAAVVLSLVVALGFSAPAKASAAEGGVGLAAGSAQVTTQEDVTMCNPEWVSLWAADPNGDSVSRFLINADQSLAITNVTSSDASVLKVKKIDTRNNYWSYTVYPLKAGSATLSVTYTQNGATKTISEKYTVKTFPNAFKSIKFNGTALAVPTSKNPVTSDELFGFKGTSGKMEVKLASGWKLGGISAYFYDKNYKDLGNLDVTNGKAFTIKKKAQFGHVGIDIYNDNGDNFYYNLSINRGLPLELTAKPVLYIGYPKTRGLPFSMIRGTASDFKVTSVKSSKPSVISVKKKANLFKVTMRAKKVGKATITVKYKFKGKSYTAKTTCTVSKDYPVKSVAVNGKSLKLKKNPYGYVQDNYKKNTGKVKITAAKGWTVKSLVYYSDTTVQKGKKIKNGASVKTAKGKQAYVLATLKKGKTTFTYYVYFNRA